MLDLISLNRNGETSHDIIKKIFYYIFIAFYYIKYCKSIKDQ